MYLGIIRWAKDAVVADAANDDAIDVDTDGDAAIAGDSGDTDAKAGHVLL